MGVFAVECLVVNNQPDNNNKDCVNYLWMLKLSTKWTPVAAIVSHNRNESLLDVPVSHNRCPLMFLFSV